jgi:hypothetical protein
MSFTIVISDSSVIYFCNLKSVDYGRLLIKIPNYSLKLEICSVLSYKQINL